MISDDEDLERDIMICLRGHMDTGAWLAASQIGVEVGFQRWNGAERVKRVLKKYLKDGTVEFDKTEKPIVYRIKPTTQSDNQTWIIGCQY